MSKDALLAVIAEWLEEWEMPALVPRDAPDVQPENLKRILAVVGPRRAGKTYFMYQLIQALLSSGRYSKKQILFMDFEDYRLGEIGPDAMEEILVAFHRLAGQYPVFLFFDEIQHLPNWNRVLRTLHNRARFRIVVSGSNSKLLSSEIASELRGRYEDLLMLPFSFCEYLRYRNVPYSHASMHTAARGKILAAFDDYLKHGGFPEVALSKTRTEQRKILQGYFRTIFFRDILDRYNIKARSVLDALMNDVLENYADIFSIARFEKQLRSNDMPCSKRTISNYVSYLKEAFFIISHERFSFSSRRRIMNPKKVYLSDTGFAALGHPFSENRGRILENLVAVEFFRRGMETYYFKNRNECDFVVKEGRNPAHAIQVCWELTTRNEKRELAGLKEACKALELRSGIILTYDQEQEWEANGIKIAVMPVWKWLLEDDTPPVP